MARGQIDGLQLVGQRRFLARQGQFIASRIDARNGALGVVPAELDGAIVTNDFPLFDVDPERLDPEFLGWLSRTDRFVELCRRASEGTTNRVRLKEDRFLALQIALPSVEEQRRIVEFIKAIAGKIEEARRLRREAEEAICSLLTSERRHVFGDRIREDWLPLSAYIGRIEAGKSPSTLGRPATLDEWGVLKVGAVSFGRFDDSQQKALPQGYVPSEALEVKPGDFIVSRANTTGLVGSCAVVGSTRPRLMLSDKTFRLHLRPESGIDAQWLEQALRAPVIRRQIEASATGTSPTMKNISQAKLMAVRVPRVHPSEQRAIVARLEGIAKIILHGQTASSDIQIGLDAVMPTVLDKAIKGPVSVAKRRVG